MREHDGAASGRTYLGRTLSADGILSPRRHIGWPLLRATSYVDDLFIWDEHRSWLLSRDEVLITWASGHTALSELRSARPWDAARVSGLPTTLPERNGTNTGAMAAGATTNDVDDVSACAVWGDPDDREELVLTVGQEHLYRIYWGIREEERLGLEEVD